MGCQECPRLNGFVGLNRKGEETDQGSRSRIPPEVGDFVTLQFLLFGMWPYLSQEDRDDICNVLYSKDLRSHRAIQRMFDGSK